MGMALHAAPGLLRCALLDVPFLDVLGAMADPTLPLTARERPEWGDPTASQVGGPDNCTYDFFLSCCSTGVPAVGLGYGVRGRVACRRAAEGAVMWVKDGRELDGVSGGSVRSG